MKLLSIELHNFLSHAATRWEPNGARLASIVGANGAGKSALLEGMKYVLYDDARAKNDALVRLGATDMSAAVTFEMDGATYRAVAGRSTLKGGKSFRSLAVQAPDGSWTPMTLSDDVKEGKAAVERLLRLEAATFGVAAFLRQGHLDAFIAADPAEQKRVLIQALDLEQYAAGEKAAKDELRALELRVAGDRALADRLDAEVREIRASDVANLDDARRLLGEAIAAIAAAQAGREAAETRIRELEGAIAAAQAVADQIAGLGRERDALGEQWRAAGTRAANAKAEIARLQALQSDRADVDAAVAELPGAKATLEQLVAGEAEERRLQREIADMDRAIRDLELPHQQVVATWTAQHDAAAAKVAELEAHARSGASVCVTCGQPIDRDTALEQLQGARQAAKDLGERPQEPIAIARARAGRIRVADRLTALAWDPAALITAREVVARLERLSARREGIDGAAASIAREQRAITEAEAEQAAITTRGRAIASEISALQPRLVELDEHRQAVASSRKGRDERTAQLHELEANRRTLERAIAAGEERLGMAAQREQQAAEIRARLATDDVAAARLRKLVEAFGVKGIPSRIIAGALPELERNANELLGELRPGMRLSIATQRAKKSSDGVVETLDLIVRDDAGERALDLYSGGERMSVSLALAVGLSRLVARRAGARIATLVVDEPDGLDRDARRAFGQALQVIAHRGDLERCVLVSHHEDLAEYGDEIYQVTKGPNGSVVELVGQ